MTITDNNKSSPVVTGDVVEFLRGHAVTDANCKHLQVRFPRFHRRLLRLLRFLRVTVRHHYGNATHALTRLWHLVLQHVPVVVTRIIIIIIVVVLVVVVLLLLLIIIKTIIIITESCSL